MLQKLTIQNYAIIDRLEIQFSPQLNIITGETGAGKSILLGALMLILGERADQDALYDKSVKCVIEGIFTSGEDRISRFLDEQGLDQEPLTTIRREISGTGKSRAFVNDTPVNLDQLAELGSLLVDLHQQMDTGKLGTRDFQTEVLDALCNHDGLLREYREAFRELQWQSKELDRIKSNIANTARELDYHRFLLSELEELSFRDQEIEDLETVLRQLTHAEEVKTALENIQVQLLDGETPVTGQLKQMQAALQPLSGFHPDLPELVRRLGAAGVELQDIAGDIVRINDHVVYDTAQINQVSERLAGGYRLLKKHHVQTTADLLIIRDKLQEKLDSAETLDNQLINIQQVVEKLSKQVSSFAEKLSHDRLIQSGPLAERVNTLLEQVGMPGATLKVSIQSREPGDSGQDEVEFLFDANASGHFLPVRKVASGGELSRLMLCVKSLVAKSLALPTLIFDEIDSGISGEAARQVGMILKDLSGDHQVLCITHQPQIAGRGDVHYYVYKEVLGDRIVTRIRELNREERISAIARMLGGEMPTAAALENAREMMQG
ncbi:MAG TPA: DNA repair protein RecN [Chitinophagaceae bacterium]|nr:DNA repair protein RecN [Chitinophagaceae bacterium]